MNEPIEAKGIAYDLAEGIIRDYVRTGCAIALCGGRMNDFERGFAAGVDQVLHLHLAQPWLPAVEIINALELAGWQRPADPGINEVTS
jgi:hypothetical protein